MILDAFNLKGKVAIITGARTGLGQGMAFGLAEAGADIVGVGRYNLNETREGVEERGRKFLGIEADLSDIKVIENIINQTVQKFGHMDILINDAGIIRRADAIDFSEKDWDDVMAINLKTVFFFSQAVAKQFIKQKTGGKIINIASMLSFQGGIRVPSYTASKSGVMGITRLMANEWAQFNININAIAPGYMATDNTAPIRRSEKKQCNIGEDTVRHAWPGNVRELRNAMERVAILAPGAVLVGADLDFLVSSGPGSGVRAPDGAFSVASEMERLEREIVLQVLDRCRGRMTRAAEELGLERSHLYKKLKALGIDRRGEE